MISFDKMSEAEARQWPELIELVERKVRPEREGKASDLAACPWWQFWRPRMELREATKSLSNVFAISCHTEYVSFALAPARTILSHALVVIASESFQLFTLVQSRVHEIWARFFGSSLEGRLRYTPSDCFETFPFPAGFKADVALEAAGREYYEFRAALMQDLWLGLTEIYNLFHSPDDEALARLETLSRKRAASSDWRTAEKVPADRSPLKAYSTPAAALVGVQHLRELHAAMDAAVLIAYGWTDLLLKCTCEFLLDYEAPPSLTTPARQATGRAAVKGKSPGATAGPTRSATKSSPASSDSTPSGPSRNASPAWRRPPPSPRSSLPLAQNAVANPRRPASPSPNPNSSGRLRGTSSIHEGQTRRLDSNLRHRGVRES
ncbi:MAG: hypothetical protein HY735_17825 [Verrucomicrobia bacterium]|nr:hypothetical protein [Verrucomicrobiota bacterium]